MLLERCPVSLLQSEIFNLEPRSSISILYFLREIRLDLPSNIFRAHTRPSSLYEGILMAFFLLPSGKKNWKQTRSIKSSIYISLEFAIRISIYIYFVVTGNIISTTSSTQFPRRQPEDFPRAIGKSNKLINFNKRQCFTGERYSAIFPIKLSFQINSPGENLLYHFSVVPFFLHAALGSQRVYIRSRTIRLISLVSANCAKPSKEN